MSKKLKYIFILAAIILPIVALRQYFINSEIKAIEQQIIDSDNNGKGIPDNMTPYLIAIQIFKAKIRLGSYKNKWWLIGYNAQID